MPIHQERKPLPFTPDQMFDLVAAIDTYPQFLPWCTGARIRKPQPGTNDKGQPCEFVTADLSIRFKVFRETFASRVMLDPESRTIVIEYLDGPFKHLENKWHFEPLGENETTVDFFIDFEFKSKPLQLLIGSLFGHAVEKMMSAFETRAAEIYGDETNTK